MLEMQLKTMASNKEIIVSGIKYLGIALPFMLIGPILLTIGFRAMNDGNYLFLIIGIVIIIAAIILAFKGVAAILNGFFNSEKDGSE
ncbi:hypothetical protein KH5_22150 [Urechidicola sp. KH5]